MSKGNWNTSDQPMIFYKGGNKQDPSDYCQGFLTSNLLINEYDEGIKTFWNIKLKNLFNLTKEIIYELSCQSIIASLNSATDDFHGHFKLYFNSDSLIAIYKYFLNNVIGIFGVIDTNMKTWIFLLIT